MLERNGGNLGASGSVAWQFDRKGQVFVDTSRYEEDRVLEAALEAGAEDLAREGSEYLITCEAAVFQEVQEGLGRAGIEPSQAEMSMIPKAEVDVAGKDAERLIKLLGILEDHDDVQKVYSNGNIDEELLEKVG
jgi:transcriptional/translational regulatory protein YebC/TACO1